MHDHHGDEQLFSVFEQIGADLQKVREINFYFYFPSEAHAKQAQSMLAARKVESIVNVSRVSLWKRLFEKPAFSVLATRQMALDKPLMKKITSLFQQIATKCSGRYDGWEACMIGDSLDIGNV